MTEKEAIKALEVYILQLEHSLAEEECEEYSKEEREEAKRKDEQTLGVLNMAIKALEEIQQYREIGTVEQVKNQKHNLEVAYKIIGNYQGIGTVEECRELKERNTPKKAKLISGLSPMCPECGASILKNYDNCKRCGQAIDCSKEWAEKYFLKSNGKTGGNCRKKNGG